MWKYWFCNAYYLSGDTAQEILVYRIYPKYSNRQAYANTVDPDQILPGLISVYNLLLIQYLTYNQTIKMTY